MITPNFSQLPISKKACLILLALFGLWFFFLWNAFEGGRSFGLWMDNEFMIGTILSSMSASLRDGNWPFRMDTVLGGFPLYNLTQLSPFYPFYFTPLPIFKSPIDVVHSLHWLTLIHLLIFEINMYIFIRAVGTSRLAAITGAALVAFSANSVVYAAWININAPYAWLPLYLAGLVGILRLPGSKLSFSMALSGMVLLTLASPSQPLIHAIFLTIIFVIAYLRHQLRIASTVQAREAVVRIVVIAVLAILLTAPVIFPALVEYKNMVRWVGPFPPVVGNGRLSFGAFTYDQLSIADLSGVFFNFKSADVGSQFVGILPFALATIAVISKPRSWLVGALAFIAVYSLISSTGSNLGLAYLNYIVPMLNKIREPSRFLVLFQLAVGVLAALGIDELRKLVLSKVTENDAKRQLIALVIIVVVATVSLFVVPKQLGSYLLPIISLLVFIALISLVWILAHREARNRDTIVAVVWSGAALILLTFEVPWLPGPVSSSIYLTKSALPIDMAIKRVATLDPTREYRVIFDGKVEKPMASMLASYRNVRTFNSFICPAPYRQFMEMYYHGPRSPDNYFRILGGKYMICKECTEKSLIGYKYLESVAGHEIYETQDVLPRSYIVQNLNGNFLNLQDFMKKAASADLAKKVLFVEPNVAVGFKKANGNTEADCLSREDNRTVNHSRFVVQCKSAGVLVLNEFFDDAWKVTVDGVKIPTLRVNGNQMGAAFKPGAHIIEFQYAPSIFSFSLILIFIGFVIVVSIYSGGAKGFWKFSDNESPCLDKV
jgi:hypothetical protein